MFLTGVDEDTLRSRASFDRKISRAGLLKSLSQDQGNGCAAESRETCLRQAAIDDVLRAPQVTEGRFSAETPQTIISLQVSETPAERLSEVAAPRGSRPLCTAFQTFPAAPMTTARPEN